MRAPSLLVRDLAVHAPVTVLPNETINACAKRMHEEHVGCLVVVENTDGVGFPVGMLTTATSRSRSSLSVSIRMPLLPAT